MQSNNYDGTQRKLNITRNRMYNFQNMHTMHIIIKVTGKTLTEKILVFIQHQSYIINVLINIFSDLKIIERSTLILAENKIREKNLFLLLELVAIM